MTTGRKRCARRMLLGTVGWLALDSCCAFKVVTAGSRLVVRRQPTHDDPDSEIWGQTWWTAGLTALPATRRSDTKSVDGSASLLYILKGVQDRERIRTREEEAERALVGVAGELGVGQQEEEEQVLPYVPTADEDFEVKLRAVEEERGDLQKLSKKVEERLLQQRYDEVRAPYKEPKTARPLPFQMDLMTFHAKEALRARNFTEASDIYNQCIEADPYDGRAWIGLARIELRRRNNTAARHYYERAMQYCSDNPFVLQAYGVLEQRSGNHRKAMEYYNAALKHKHDHSAAWLAKAQLLWELGKKKDARETFRTAVQTNTNNEVLWHAWGVAEKRDGNYAVARKLLRKATQINPRNSFCWHAWAVMEQGLHNDDLAVELFKNALKAFPNSSHTYQAWACLERDRQNWDIAFKLFREGIERRPWDGGAYQPYALALKERGMTTRAIEVFQRGLRADPYHCPLYQAFGMLLVELDRLEDARAIFAKGTRLNPRGKFVYYIWHAWAVLEARSGNLPLARRYFQKVLEYTPRSIPTLVALAQLEEMDGNLDACRQFWERVLTIRPESATYWQQYEDMERRHGNLQRVTSIDRRRSIALNREAQGMGEQLAIVTDALASGGRRRGHGREGMGDEDIMPPLTVGAEAMPPQRVVQDLIKSLQDQGREQLVRQRGGDGDRERRRVIVEYSEDEDEEEFVLSTTQVSPLKLGLV